MGRVRLSTTGLHYTYLLYTRVSAVLQHLFALWLPAIDVSVRYRMDCVKKKYHISTLKISQFMSEFCGLWTFRNNSVCTKRVTVVKALHAKDLIVHVRVLWITDIQK